MAGAGGLRIGWRAGAVTGGGAAVGPVLGVGRGMSRQENSSSTAIPAIGHATDRLDGLDDGLDDGAVWVTVPRARSISSWGASTPGVLRAGNSALSSSAVCRSFHGARSG